MTALRRHVVAVVAALFALAVGIAIGGGPLSYVPDDGPSSATTPDDDVPAVEEPEGPDELSAAFVASVAPALYDDRLLGHPVAVLALPGADQDVVDDVVAQVAVAGGGLTGVFELEEPVTDLGEASLVDSLGSQLMTRLSTELDDDRVDPLASTYVRFGQLVALAISTRDQSGVRADEAAESVRSTLATADLMTSPDGARLAPLVVAVLPPHDADDESLLATAGVFRGLAVGLSDNPAGLVLLGDEASGRSGILAALREDDELTSVVTTVDGADTGVGQVTAMLALIRSLDSSVGSYGASGSDGPAPLP